MNAAKKKAADKDLVFGLGSTGLSIARYLQRYSVATEEKRQTGV